MALLRLFSAVPLAVVMLGLSIACDASSPGYTQDSLEPTATVGVSPEIAVLAHRLVFAYMSDKAWGFFGATCEMWIEDDYRWDKSMGELQADGRIKVTYERHEDRILGPEQLVFYVDIDSQEVEGDNEPDIDTGRLGVAEGCDQW